MERLTGSFSLLLVFLAFAYLSHLPLASADAPRIVRTPSAQKEYRRHRQLTAIERGVRPPLHTSDTSEPPIKYRGRPMMTKNPSINVYLIYYGSWPEGSGQNIIENFIQSLSADSDQQGSPADPQVKLWWAISVAYTQEVNGTKTNVSSQIGDGKPFPYDVDGIYLLLSSTDVTVPDLCTKLVGWHNMRFIDSAPVAFGFVGHPGGQCNQDWIRNPSPNGNPAIDFMIPIIGHEIAEAATDPEVETGWADENREENVDKCHDVYGDTKTGQDSSGGTYEYNVVGLNNMRFLIPSNWDWEKNMCVIQRNYP
ncbi:unnamed protein product [Closterium sp. NIES-54]